MPKYTQEEFSVSVRKAFLTDNGMARVKAIAWSKDYKCLSLLGFDDRWVEIWLDNEDVTADGTSDMFITNNGTPAGGASETLWGDWD